MPSVDGAAGTSTAGRRSMRTRRGLFVTPASRVGPKGTRREGRGPLNPTKGTPARMPGASGSPASVGSPDPPSRVPSGVIGISASRSTRTRRGRTAASARPSAGRIAARSRPVSGTSGTPAAVRRRDPPKEAAPTRTTKAIVAAIATPTRPGLSGRSRPATGASGPLGSATIFAAAGPRRCILTPGTRPGFGISGVSARAGGRTAAGGSGRGTVSRKSVGPA